MGRRNYYVVLGVSPRESPENIRSAYRRRARELHPDTAGIRSAGAFRELTEAYETLSDPVKRRAYDRSQEGRGSRNGPRRRRGPVAGGPENLVPDPASPLRYRRGVGPTWDAVYGWVRRSFGGYAGPGPVGREALHFEVRLHPAEAARGGTLPVAVPVMVPCPACEGSSGWMFPCVICEGRGGIEEERTGAARIPPGVRDGETLEYSLEEFGYRNLFLRLHLVIQE